MNELTISPPAFAQLVDAYKAMATRARYRPEAPSDGFGSITVPLADLDLDAEAQTYAAEWTAEEDDGRFHVGCTDFRTAKATVYAMEAARTMCGASPGVARRLLRMAMDELDNPSPTGLTTEEKM